MMTRLILATLAAFLVATIADAGWDPPGWRRPPPREVEASTNPAAVPLMWAVRLFQTTASRVDGPRCPSYPTCSAYAVESLGEHGPVLGFALTAGRLLSDADEAAFSPRIFVGGKWRVYAPVEDDLAFLKGGLDP
jgi:hypothetical protein